MRSVDALDARKRVRITVRVVAAVACLTAVPSVAHAQSNTVDREFVEGDFEVSVARDVITDEDTSFILSIADNEEGALGWRCLEDGLNVVLAIGGYYEGDEDDDIVVQYRFDEEEADPQEYWALFAGKESAYIRMHRVAPFTARARESRSIAVRAVDPYDDETRTFIFGLEGLDQAMKYLPCT